MIELQFSNICEHMAYTLNDGWYTDEIDKRQIRYGFGSKHSLTIRQHERVRSLYPSISIENSSVFQMEQVHGISIAIIRKKMNNQYMFGVDGMITDQPQCILTARTADCIPIVYYDKKNHIIGISHQGWKGTFLEMAKHMIYTMENLGAEKSHISVFIGPSICVNHYPIYGDRLDSFTNHYAQWRNQIIQKKEHTYYLNMSLLNRLQLCEAGIRPQNISICDLCTYEHADSFFSYRRDGTIKNGEMVNYACLLPA